MHRLLVILFVAVLAIPAAQAAAPYRFEAQLEQSGDNFKVKVSIFKTQGKGELVSAPQITFEDGSTARMRIGPDKSGHKVDVQVYKPKGEPFALVVFTAKDGKTIIQAESTKLELGQK
jgi:hypothetical protein